MAAIRAGREAGTACGASCSDPGREACTCNLMPGHRGNMHNCFGQGNHNPHQWYIDGAEIPPAEPIDTPVQCPECNTIFDSAAGRPPDAAKPPKPPTAMRQPNGT